MFARLWWKEYRVFGPVWLILVVAAGLLQWLFLSVHSEDSRTGGLTFSALCWAVLYAFAAGSAALSGERESKTLGFLDALPVARVVLWLGKASFVLVSTFGTETRDPLEIYGYPELSRLFGTVLFEAVAWGLLWSSLSKNPLLAGVMGVLSVYASAAVISLLPGMDVTLAKNEFVPPAVVPARLGVALVALAVSGLVMAWRPLGRSSSRSRLAVPEAPTIRLRASSTGRSLIWQACREGWTTWVLIGLVVLLGPFAVEMTASPSANLLGKVLWLLASLVAGVSVFGTENASGSRRFLVQHGVAPATVWWQKLLVWGVAMGSIAGLFLAFAWSMGRTPGLKEAESAKMLVAFSLALLNAFAVGVLCGMEITRRMTAALVGVIVLIAVLPIQLGLVLNEMVPSWAGFLVPLILVAASGAWSGDWLMEREGARPWLRLGIWLVVPMGLLFGSYVTYRAYGVPDVRPQFVGATVQAPAPPADQDAALAYEQAAALIRPMLGLTLAVDGSTMPVIEEIIERDWDPGLSQVVAYWKSNLPAIERARKASTLPTGRFADATGMTIGGNPGRPLQGLRAIDKLLALDTRERLSRGDLPGAWDDILAQLRMAHQIGSNAPTMTRTLLATAIHHRSVGLAFHWLGANGQSPEILGRALADLKVLPTLPHPSTMIQVESSIIERSLDLSGDELIGLLWPPDSIRPTSTLERLWFARVVAAPWERQRARRVGRLWIARQLAQFWLEPYQRPAIADFLAREDPIHLEQERGLSRWLLPDLPGVLDRLDRELVGRRALDQAVAIEAWKLGHDGKYPETLEDLVTKVVGDGPPPVGPGPQILINPRRIPGLLDRLPLDPYSGGPFRYARFEGQEVPLPNRPDLGPSTLPSNLKPGQRFLYSVGPDRKDDGGRAVYWTGSVDGIDLTFPLP
jgi:hypothetical protein